MLADPVWMLLPNVPETVDAVWAFVAPDEGEVDVTDGAASL